MRSRLSNGLETYVQHDIITSPKGLEEYLHSYISVLPYNELGAAAAAYNADEKELCRLDEIYSAVKTPFEIRSGSEKVTRQFFQNMQQWIGKASQGFIKA